MNIAHKLRSLTTKFLILLSVILMAAVADYELFLMKSKQAGYYEDLNSRLAHIRVSVTKLEYALDMFVVAKRFEDTTVSMIRQDVDELDLEIKELYDDYGTNWLVEHDTTVSEGLDKLSDDWFEIKTEVARLNSASTPDEVMLIHNVVDLHTIMITEKADQLLSLIITDSKRVITELKVIMQGTIIVVMMFFMGLALYLYLMVYKPMLRTASSSVKIAAGWPGLRFPIIGSGVAEDLTGELNAMLTSIEKTAQTTIDSRNRLAGDLAVRTTQVDVLRIISELASRSLDMGVVLRASVHEAVSAGGVSAAAIYVRDGDSFTLKASDGFDDKIPVKITSFDPALYSPARVGAARHTGAADSDRDETGTDARSSVFSGQVELPTDALGRYAGAAGFDGLIYVPIEYDMTQSAALVAAWRQGDAHAIGNRRFFESLSASIGTLGGYIDLVHRTHSSTKFLERIIRQLPFGVAVFDRDGRCVVSNSALGKLLGAPDGFDFAGEYRVEEDTVFVEAGLTTSIEKAYEGFSTEIIINYNPSLQKTYDFKGPVQKMRLRSLPIYDAGGEIAEIALIYEPAFENNNEKQARAGERGR